MTAAHAARPSPFHVEIPAPAPVRGVLNGALDRLLGLARLNAAYAAIPDGTSPAGFACEALRALRVEFDVADEDFARDLDRFDEHYRHLVLWDRAAGAVAGAYRFARTTEVLPARGATGLYTTTLFRLGPGFFERLGPAVELGRSFVAPAWQRSFSPLMLLWKAIGAVVLEQPDCRTLFGPVSISQRYAPFARHLMVEWLRLRAPATAFEPLSAPLRPVRGPAADVRRARAAAATLPDVDALSDAVADMEPALRGVPILVREYLRLSGRFASFSVDPEFGGVVDGLVVIDLTTTERRILARYMGRDGADRFLANAASRDAAPAPGA